MIIIQSKSAMVAYSGPPRTITVESIAAILLDARLFDVMDFCGDVAKRKGSWWYCWYEDTESKCTHRHRTAAGIRRHFRRKHGW